jgi:hypothetical protein
VGLSCVGTSASTVVSLDDVVLNFGSVGSNYSNKFQSLDFGNKAWVSGTAPPTTGTWTVGSMVWNSNPAANSIVAWICVTAGSPGTWSGISIN